MSGPWEKYANQDQKGEAPAATAPGPWSRFAQQQVQPTSVTDDMTTAQKFWAGMGQGMASAGRGLLQGISKVTGADKVGAELIKQSEIDDARQTDAPLLETRAGNLGSAAGKGAVAMLMAPAAPASLPGAIATGAATSGLLEEGDVGDRLKAAGFGGVGGGLGKLAGDAVGAGARKLLSSRESAAVAKSAANSARDGTLAAAQEAGYVVTPSQAGAGGVINGALESLGGKIKTQQAASVRNQEVTNNLARQALGLPKDAPITAEALDAIRAEAGKAYQAVAGLGKLDATRASLPSTVAVEEGISPLLAGKTKSVDASELVRAWKQANADATAYFRAYGRDANPETLAKAKAAGDMAKQIDDFIGGQLLSMQRGDLGKALKEARVRIAKTYSVENALANQVGDVSAPKLAAQLAKGKPLSGELKSAAEFAGAFPKSAQSNVDVPAWSVLDMMGGATAGASGLGPVAALFAARPVARAAVLNPAYQKAMVSPSLGPGLIAMAAPLALESNLAKALARSIGTVSAAEAGH